MVVNGVVCEEISAPDDVDEEDSTLINKYIEASPGARFVVHVSILPEALALRRHEMVAWVKVDGQLI